MLKYLLSYLTGQTKAAVKGIRLADNNYDTVIKVLTDRFGRISTLIDDHIDYLLALQPIRASSDVSKLRDLYNSVAFRIRAPESLGILHRILLKVFPADLSLNVPPEDEKEASTTSSTIWNPAQEVQLVLDFLRIYVEIK